MDSAIVKLLAIIPVLIIPLIKMVTELIRLMSGSTVSSSSPFLKSRKHQIEKVLSQEKIADEMRSLYELEQTHEQMAALGIKNRKLTFPLLKVHDLMGEEFNLQHYVNAQDMLDANEEGELFVESGWFAKIEKWYSLGMFLFTWSTGALLLIAGGWLFWYTTELSSVNTLLYGIVLLCIGYLFARYPLRKFKSAKVVKQQLEKYNQLCQVKKMDRSVELPCEKNPETENQKSPFSEIRSILVKHMRNI